MPQSSRHLRHISFVLLALLLTLGCILFATEWTARRTLCQWPQCDLIRNPDHRMTRQFYRDINGDGIRSKQEADAFQPEDFNVIFLGDSFVWGWFEPQNFNYPAKKTIPAQFERIAHERGISNTRAANFGWVSASPLLESRLLADIGHKYHPDLVVMVVDMTDFHDDRLYQAILERQRIYGIAQWLPATFSLISWYNNNALKSEWLAQTFFGVPLGRYRALEQPLEQSLPDFQRTLTNIDTTRQLSEQLGARFAVFILPRYFHYSRTESPDDWEKAHHHQPGPYSLEPFRFFEQAAAERPYPIVSLLPDMQTTTVFPTTWRNDPHLTPEGSGVVADAIWHHLQQHGMLPAAIKQP